MDRDLWMQSYVQTYLERDLRNMERVSDPGLASWMLGYRTTDAIMNGPAWAR